MQLAPDDELGPFTITGLVRAGGMGAVYRGVHRDTGEAAAIKTVTAPRASLLPAIRREIDALGRLHHPGIVRILASGARDGVPWYAMELLGERSLADLRAELWAEGAPDPERRRTALTLVRRLCEPLAYLHGEGLVHGDLKPDNVLIGADDRPVLIDLGLLTTFAEQPGRDLLATRLHGVGTAAYMAPEQIDGELVDARADLYALGCLLHELLTGQPPFTDPRLADLLHAHRTRPPSPPAGLPPALADLLLRLLAKQPRDRIGHADDVAARLAALGAAASRERGPRARPYLYRPGLAGRRPTLEQLHTTLADRFTTGRGDVTVLVGESGVGKTRLALELSRRAQALGARVLSGGCDPQGGALAPFARPLLALVDHCRGEGPDETRRLLAGRHRLLARYQPALAGLPGLADTDPPPADLPPEAARALVTHELCATLTALAADRPLLLVLDDLQWADELSLAVLARLATTLTDHRVCVVATARSDELGPALAPLLAAATRVDLDRLDEHGVRGMIADMLALPAPGDGFVRFIAGQTEGNPFFVAEYLRAAVREGLLARDPRGRFRPIGDDEASLAALALPRSLHDLIARRLDALDPPLRRVVAVAAVLGRDVDATLLADVAAIDAAEFTRVSSELVARQILEDSGDDLRFAHDKLREVALDRLEPAARGALHRRVAALLTTRQDLAPARGLAATAAQHWLAAGDPAKAAPLLLAAARRSAQECDNHRSELGHRRTLEILAAAPPDLAAELFARRTLWLDPDDPGAAPLVDAAATLTEARRRAHRGLGDALTTTGRHDDALAHYTAALPHCPGALARADLLGRIGAAWFAKGELTVAAGHLGDALTELGEPLPTTRPGLLASIGRQALRLAVRLARPTPVSDAPTRAREALRVRILNRLTYINYSFSIERAVQAHLAALAAAERIASTRDAAETFAHHGPLFAGHLPWSARHYARRAVAVCRREGHLAMQMTAEFMAGMCFTFQARWDPAITHFRAAIALYPRVGDHTVLQTSHENLAYALLYRGDHREALTEASRSLELAGRAGDLRGQCNSSCHVALAALRLGDLAQAQRVIADAAAILDTLADHVLHCIVHTVRGRIHRAAGELAAARSALTQAVAIAGHHHLEQEEVAPAYTELLELHAALPPTRETHRLRTTARKLARRFPAHTGPRLRAEALLLARDEQPREARRALARAIELLRAGGLRHELARSLELSATLNHSATDRAEALRLYRATEADADARRVAAASDR